MPEMPFECTSINSVWQYYPKYYGFSILKYICKPQWSLGKHCVLVTFSMPTRPKWTGAALLGCECRMYARSNRSRGLNLPGISLLQFRNVSQVYWHSLREPHEIHKSSMPGGMPPASTSCKVRTTLSVLSKCCEVQVTKYSAQRKCLVSNTDIRRLMMGILSEKCVFGDFSVVWMS